MRWILLVLFGWTLAGLTACFGGAQEGMEPGECSDGADNDADGDFDCNDVDCFGAPDCGELTEVAFNHLFGEKYCSAWADCNPGLVCDDKALDSDTTVQFEECTFSSVQARQCLDSAFECDTSNSAFPVVVLPPSCLSVYECA